MEPIHAFLSALATGLVISISVCILFRKSLHMLLAEVCGGEARGRFWLQFGNVCMVLATLWIALWFVPRDPGVADAKEPVVVFIRTLMGATFGLLGALVVLGVVLIFGIGMFNSRQRAERRAALRES